jgi:hypothetical protein
VPQIIDNLVTKIDFDANSSTMERLATLALKLCPAGASIELEQSLEGVGATRVKLTKPEERS